MDSRYIVSFMSGFLHDSASQLADWLSPKLNKISSDWWNDCVLGNLTSQQLYNIEQNKASKLDELDLAALLHITDNNWHLIEKDKNKIGRKMPITRKMLGVRNTWAHIPARLPNKQQIINDAKVIEEFLKQLSSDKGTINDIEAFIDELAKAREITNDPKSERNNSLLYRKQPSYQTFCKGNDRRTMLPKPKETKGKYTFSITDESTGKKCEVTKSALIGRGASCLVYSGTLNLHGIKSGSRNVIIKEFYPIEYAIKGVRRKNADLIIPEALVSEFNTAMQGFVNGQLKHVQFANENSNNALSPMFFSGEANNTYYFISDLNKGTVLSEKIRKKYSIVDALELVVSICEDLYAVHQGSKGIPYLYLDCKPNNLFVKEKIVNGKTVYGTQAYLFDFDSVQEWRKIRFCSRSEGWSAPEQEFNKEKTCYKDISKIGFQTDIFAIANLMVWLLVGKSALEIGLDNIQKGFDWKSNITLNDTTDALKNEYFIMELNGVLEDMLCFDANERAKIYGEKNAADLAARYVGFVLKEATDATAKKRHEETLRRIEEAAERIERRIDDRADEIVLESRSIHEDIQSLPDKIADEMENNVSEAKSEILEQTSNLSTVVQDVSERVDEAIHLIKGLSKKDATPEVSIPISSSLVTYVNSNELFMHTGEVKAVYSDGSTYVGEWKYGNRQGYGRYTTADKKQVYIGNWDCDLRCGQGRLIDEEEGEYNGNWENDKMNGHNGIFKYKDGRFYKGDWKDGLRSGSGFFEKKGEKTYIGQWENDKPSGKGMLKLLVDGSEYNGNFKNGVPDGEGVYLFSSGNKYEGHWRNGKRHGHGVLIYSENDPNKRDYYDGEWVEGKRKGQGTLVWKNGEKYVGEHDDVRNGHGKDYYVNGDVYDGEWKDDKCHGKGKLTYGPNDPNKRDYYDGDWKDGIRKGHGILVWKNGVKYDGEHDDIRSGHGIAYYLNGDVYDGEWKNDRRHGRGKLVYADNKYGIESYDGEWEEGIRKGHGIMKWKNGTVYDGEWDDVRNGHGIDYYSNGDVYDGEWKNDKCHGKGKLTYGVDDPFKRDYYDGEWIDGIREGKGTLVYSEGSKFEGLFINDSLCGKVKVTDRNGSIEHQFFISGKRATKEMLDSTDIDDPFFQILKMEADFDSIKKANYGFTTKKRLYRACKILKQLLETEEGRALVSEREQQIISDLYLCKRNYSVEAARSGDVSLYSIGDTIVETIKCIISNSPLEEEIIVRIGERISEGLSREQLDIFDACKTQEESLEWLKVNRPDYRQIVKEVRENVYRKAFKSEYLNNDILPYPIFNSVNNHPKYGNEKEFVHIRRYGDQKWLRSITLQAGKQYEVKAFFRNDSHPEFNQSDYDYCGVALRSTIAIDLPSEIEKEGNISVVFSAKNTCINAIDNVFLYSADGDYLKLRYISGSAKIYNKWKANESVLPTSLFNYPTGTLVGLNDLNGVIPGGDEYSGYILFVFEVK